MCLIRHGLTLSFIHPVVSQQFALVAREGVVRRSGYLLYRQGFGPDPGLQHIAV